jgi:type IV secretion system protein TrbL
VAAETGRAAAWSALAGRGEASAPDASGEQTPAWARQLRRQQDARHHRHVAVQALREGDRGGAGATPDISEMEE